MVNFSLNGLKNQVNLFLKPEEIIVHPVELPNGDIVWSQDAAEDEKILARWNKMME